MADNFFEGIIIVALERKEGISKTTAKPWAMQDFVIEQTHGAFPARMVFTVSGKDKLDTWQIVVGQHLRVHFEVNAREYNGKYYNSVRAWKVEQLQQVAQPTAVSTPPPSEAQPTPAANVASPALMPTQDELFNSDEDPNNMPF